MKKWLVTGAVDKMPCTMVYMWSDTLVYCEVCYGICTKISSESKQTARLRFLGYGHILCSVGALGIFEEGSHLPFKGDPQWHALA